MKKLSAFFEFLIKYEKVLFIVILLINLLPVLVSKYTLTVDGPSHLYNARLILELLENPTGAISDYFIFNDSFSPNWSGHIILAGLLSFLPGYLAEKILIISYLILFPVGCRMLLNNIKPKAKYFVYFIFPFTHSFLFYYGFYNFHIGIVILFFTLVYWFKDANKDFSIKPLITLGLLPCFIFFSHVFIYAILLLILFITSVTDLFETTNNRKLKLVNYSKALVAFSPSLVCFFIYLLNIFNGGTKELNYLSLENLFGMFYHVEPAKALIYSKEEVFTKWIFILIMLFLIYQLFNYFIRTKSKLTIASKQWRNVLLAVILCLFILPDGTPEFGFISTRFILFIYLILFIFLSTLNFPKWLLIVSLLVINYVNIALVKVYYLKNKEFASYSESYIEASKLIEKYSTVLPILDARDEWLYTHSSNYLGVDKPIVIKDNYEAYLNYFPLKWNNSKLKNIYLKNNKELLSHTTINQVDYVYCYGKSVNDTKIDSLLQQNYKVIYSSKDQKMRLYIKN